MLHEYLSQESPAGFTPFPGLGSTVAVDDSSNSADWAKGDEYEVITASDVVDVFEPEAGGGRKLVTQLTGTGISPTELVSSEPFDGIYHVAVNELDGDVVVAENVIGVGAAANAAIDIFEPKLGLPGEYALVRKLTSLEPNEGYKSNHYSSLALEFSVDESTGDIYAPEWVIHDSEPKEFIVEQFSPAGVPLGRITAADTPYGIGAFLSVTVDPASRAMYISLPIQQGGQNQQEPVVYIFGPNIVIPDVTVTEPVPPATRSFTIESQAHTWSTSLPGPVNPDEAGEATCTFEYGTTTSDGTPAPCTSSVLEGKLPVPVHSREVTGLLPDTTYHYRLDATNKADARTQTPAYVRPTAANSQPPAPASLASRSPTPRPPRRRSKRASTRMKTPQPTTSNTARPALTAPTCP